MGLRQANGKMVGNNSVGKQLFYFNLRNIGGTASCSVKYFENGEVARLNYSDQPDGGIQFHKVTMKFNENGEQIEVDEQQFPPERITLPLETIVPTLPKQEIATCAIVFKNYFTIQNTISLKITVLATDIRPSLPINIVKSYTIKPHEIIVIDSVITAQIPLSEKRYSLELI